MRVDLFDFDLPEDRIALRPAEPRDAARMLVVPAGGEPGHRRVSDLPGSLRAGDAIVVNDTRVIPARLRGVRVHQRGTSRVEIMLHRRVAPDRWLAFARPAKRLAVADRLAFGSPDAQIGREPLGATVEARGAGGEVALTFDRSGPALDEAVQRVGEVPLPPYIASRRPADAQDLGDYQTSYAREPGAVAAPTAGLHLTDELMAKLREASISVQHVTLHVGAGTFLPVTADDTAAHRMHAERGRIDPETAERLNETRRAGGRIVCVGTTSLRLLESAATPDGTLHPYDGETDIFITPGHRFRFADMLLTNFHTPRSTLFMLVAAFAGLDRMRAAYADAIATGYRFYSYGDACLLERGDRP